MRWGGRINSTVNETSHVYLLGANRPFRYGAELVAETNTFSERAISASKFPPSYTPISPTYFAAVIGRQKDSPLGNRTQHLTMDGQ